jgi:hypothetical protein
MHQLANNGDGIDDYGNTIVTARELASVVGLSEPQIYTLRRRGILQSVKAKRSEFQLGPSVRAYIQFKCGQQTPADADFYKERAKKERANRELREILLGQTREKLHRAEDVRAVVTDSNAQIRAETLAFAKRLALQVVGKDPAEIKTTIDAQVRELLTKLSKYDPRGFYRRQRR